MADYKFFKTGKELMGWLPVTADFDACLLHPFQKGVCKKYIECITGKELLAALWDKYETGKLKKDELNAIWPEVARPLALLSYLAAIPALNITAKPGGFMTAKSEHLEIASQWRVEDLECSIWQQAYEALDCLIKYLEENADDIPLYRDSAAYDKYPCRYINCTEELAQFIPKVDNAWIYLCMKPIMDDYQNLQMAECLGQDVHDQLIAAVKLREIPDELTACYHLLQGWLSNGAFAEAVCLLQLEIGKQGVTFLNAVNSRSNTKTFWNGTEEGRNEWARKLQEKADRYRDRALCCLTDAGIITDPEEEEEEDCPDPCSGCACGQDCDDKNRKCSCGRRCRCDGHCGCPIGTKKNLKLL